MMTKIKTTKQGKNMASIIFSAAGSAVGSTLGSAIGANIGMLAGSFAGRFVDQKLFGQSHLSSSQGARLKDLSIQSASYGQMLPIIYGTTRVAGNIIWAQPIKETPHIQTQNMGGKGSKVTHSRTEYSYAANIAISICEGVISEVTRIWANNKQIDLSKYTIRIYKGTNDQMPDPLLESIQGVGKTPAYRGQAYAVFEDFPLAEFGNHIPNFNFEVKRRVVTDGQENVEEMIESIVIIPGSGEYVYDTITQHKIHGNYIAGKWLQAGPQMPINQHTSFGKADSLVSLDQLKTTLPNIKWAAPVVTWFANSVDAKDCEILPGVEYQSESTVVPDAWGVGCYTRTTARLITQVNQKPIYGGTTNDKSILRYLDELSARGYNKMFYPMFFVDSLNKPWRGRVTGSAKEVREFFTKPNGYNNFILHYANLVKGKVDAFVIGSELIGLTKVKDENNQFPAVQELVKLAYQVKEILGKDVIVTYAADWSEYHHAEGGWYNLDDLWGCDAIDVIGIDAYFPLTNNQESTYDATEIMKGWQSGEGYDFYYDSDKTPKALGAAFAWKNLEWFWENEHINPNGEKTKWQPKSKKIWFTEYGFPSVDCSSNQPNVFHDPTSIESHFPKYSKGNMDLKAQRAAIYATEKFWQNSEMVERKFLWTWDARPYPYWPDYLNTWSDGGAWMFGHWVQGKLGVSSLGAILSDICQRAKLESADFQTNNLTDGVDGFVIDHQATIRKSIETLQHGFFFDVVENNSAINFLPRSENKPINKIDSDKLVADKTDLISIKRIQEIELAKKVDINFINLSKQFQVGNQHSIRQATASEQKLTLNLPIVMNETLAAKIADVTLYNIWMERNRYSFSLPIEYSYLSPCDILELTIDDRKHIMRITDIQLGKNFMLKVEGVAENQDIYKSTSNYKNGDENYLEDPIAKTHFEILDIPILPWEMPTSQARVFIAACGFGRNWSGCEVFASLDPNSAYENMDRIQNSATMGYVVNKLDSASPHFIDYKNKIIVNLVHGELHTISEKLFTSGGNVALVGNEIIHFKEAKLIAPFQYEISVFARGRQGTEHEIYNHVEGERFVLLNSAIQRVELPNSLIGQKRYIKAITIGETLNSAEPRELNYNGEFLKPFSVVNVKYDGSKLSWNRRTRYNTFLLDGVDVPLGEELEKYSLEIPSQSSNITTSQPEITIPILDSAVQISQISSTGLGNPATLFNKSLTIS